MNIAVVLIALTIFALNRILKIRLIVNTYTANFLAVIIWLILAFLSIRDADIIGLLLCLILILLSCLAIFKK